MAITYVDSVDVEANNPTSASFALPAGWQADDLALFWWYARDSTKTLLFGATDVVTQSSHGSSIGAYSSQPLAQSFTGVGETLAKVQVWMSRTASPTGTVWLELQADSGGNPSGTALATSASLAVGSVPLTAAYVSFTFPTTFQLDSAATYWIVIQRSAAEVGVIVYYSQTNPYAGGHFAQQTGAWDHFNNAYDLGFILSTSLITTRTDVTTNGHLCVGYRVLKTGDTTFAWTSSSVTNATTIYGCSVFRGVNLTTPFDVANPAAVSGSGVSNLPVPTITNATADACWVAFAGRNDQMDVTPGGFAIIKNGVGLGVRATVDNSGVGGNSWGSSTSGTDAGAVLGYYVLDAATTWSTDSAGFNPGGWTTAAYVAVSLALRPQPTAQTKDLTDPRPHETGAAQTLSHTQTPQTKNLTGTTPHETGAAQALSSHREQVRTLTPAASSGAAQTLGFTKAPQTKSIGAASSTGAAQTLSHTQTPQTKTIGAASSTGAAQTVTFTQAPITRTLTAAVESDDPAWWNDYTQQPLRVTLSHATPVPVLVDDFNRADEDPLSGGGAWANTRPDLADRLALVSNQVAETGGTGTGGAISYYTREKFAHVVAEMTIAKFPVDIFEGSAWFYVNARVKDEGSSGWDGYEFGVGRHPAQGGYASFRIDGITNGSNDDLSETAGAAWGQNLWLIDDGDKIRLEINGNHLLASYWHDGDWHLIFDRYDDRLVGGKYPAAGYVGLEIQAARNGVSRVDDFAVTEIPASAGETSSAQALSVSKRVTYTTLVEVDQAQPLSIGEGVQRVTLTAAASTNAAQVLSITHQGAQSLTLTAATQSDAAQALSLTHESAQTKNAAWVGEQGVAQSLTYTQTPITSTLTAAASSSAAQTLSHTQTPQTKTLTAAASTDAAQTLSLTQQDSQSAAVTSASETGAAQTLSLTHQDAQSKSITTASSSNAAITLSLTQQGSQSTSISAAASSNASVALSLAQQGGQSKSLTTAASTDAAAALTFTQTPIAMTLTAAASTNTATGVSFTQAGQQTKTLTAAATTNSAVAIAFTQAPLARTLTASGETGAAQTLSLTQQSAQSTSITTATGTNAALALSATQGPAHSVTLVVSTETGAATTLSFEKQSAQTRTLVVAVETDSARTIGFVLSGKVAIAAASETSSSTTLSYGKQSSQSKSITVSTETASASTISFTSGQAQLRSLTVAAETDSSSTLPFEKPVVTQLTATGETDAALAVATTHQSAQTATITTSGEIDVAFDVVGSTHSQVLAPSSELDTATSLRLTHVPRKSPSGGEILVSRGAWIEQTQAGELAEPVEGGVS